MVGDGDEVPFVGRTAVVASLRATLLDGVARRSAVFVTGESGVGKSRLLAETVAALRDAGATVLAGTCLDIGDASPLHPVLQALRPVRPAVRDLLGDAAEGAGALLDRVSQLLRDITGDGPLVLVLDDLQWADRSTRQLLLYLLAGLGEVDLAVLASIRAEALQGAHPLRRVLAELRRLRSVHVLEVAALDRAAVGQLVAAVVGRPVADADTDRVYERSGGNPFVAEELARDLRDGRDELSETLREVFLARVDALPPHAHAVVHAVAAGGQPVEHHVLARVMALPEEQLLEGARAAVAHRFVVGAADGYRLRHPLVAEVLAHELLPAERAALHRRYAEALSAAAGVDQARLAHHWQQAGVPARAVAALVAAARAAQRLHGYAEAHRHWTAALQLTDAEPFGVAPDGTVPERTELLEAAAEAAHQCGEHALALARLQELASARGDTCALRIRRARYLAAAGRTALAEAEYDTVLNAPECTPRERVTAAAHLAELLLHLGRYADAGSRADVALQLSGQADAATADLVRASAALGFSAALREDPDAGLAVLRQAVEIAERDGRPDDIGCAYLHLAELLTGPLNWLEEGVLVARRGAERMAALGVGRTYQTRLLAVAANGLFRVGQWAEAHRMVEVGLRHRPSGADAVELLLARCRLSVGLGDEEAAARDLDAVATVLAGGGARHVLPMLTLRAGLAMWQGRHADARQAVQRGLTETRSDDLVLLAVLAWHGLRAEAEAHSSRTTPVDASVVRRLTDVVDRVAKGATGAARPVREVVDGYLELCAAELSRLADPPDPQPWARVAAVWDRRKHPYPAAYARLRQAEAALARRTGRTTAARLLEQAYETAQAMGARPLAAEIATVAARARVRLPGAPASAPVTGVPRPRRPVVADQPSPTPIPRDPAGRPGLATLTARELEVLTAVAEGLTNREIGRRLFISERTVGVHVSHIFDKLQVRTRVQASRVLLREAAS